MDNEPNIVKALGLCSGGLDSILSGLVLKDQGIHVEWVSFETPFFSSEKARKASAKTKIPLIVKKITPVYMEMLKNPSVGYGKYMNPCMDCHALMFKLAGKIMEDQGFDFLFSGEVLGQRPMSQTASSLRYVEKNSGFDGMIVRPLSARLLPETLPEKAGKVDRERLLDLRGRSRKPQMELAAKYGITHYPAPAGGCLLTDRGFSVRLKDLLAHQPDPSEADLELLKYGRHFRLSPEVKIAVGRTMEDNEKIMTCYSRQKDFLLKMESIPGPLVLMPDGGVPEAVMKAGAICAGYGKAPEDQLVNVVLTTPSGRESLLVFPVSPKANKELLLA
ncbi:MAG: tRNA 4-thiouridine(8) synthase ThiI [Proteobacteria bacterium]|nr:tRNA 4-thiouridine(8) synthase ThiI [Pseudomonadota bacterium]